MYSNEKNVQILLSLLKAHNINKMVISPGSANASFVASAQYDKEFELYSSVDERSAAYIACGLAEESNEPVVICCTGATASRNYLPALTEAYYRKLPIVAITATRPINMIGQNRDQIIDRTTVLNDTAVKSVNIPNIYTADDEWECNLKINDTLLELRRNGNGPVHINLTTSYSLDFSVKKLPSVRVIERFSGNNMPEQPKGKIGIFVGAHSKWDKRLTAAVETFCKKYDVIVFHDQTSNYKGNYGIMCGLFNIMGYPNTEIECLIHLGNISASWPATAKEVWRVNPDGKIRDTYKKLRYVFEMEEAEFFEYYNRLDTQVTSINYKEWRLQYDIRLNEIYSLNNSIPFSSLWIAQNMYNVVPHCSAIHFGILNSLRCWNCFNLDESILGYANTGGFGIDGGVSSLIGASLVNPNKLYYGIFGDLAFFYDMNSIGNRHIQPNVRIMIVNNGLGGEFKNCLSNVQKAGLSESANDYIAASGHFGSKSKELVKHYSQDLGFRYIYANNKESFMEKLEEFINPNILDKPIVFEVFVDEHDDVQALELLYSLGLNYNEPSVKIKDITKKIVKNMLGDSGIKMLKKVIR